MGVRERIYGRKLFINKEIDIHIFPVLCEMSSKCHSKTCMCVVRHISVAFVHKHLYLASMETSWFSSIEDLHGSSQ